MSDTFGPDDLIPWQEMTKRIKALEEKANVAGDYFTHNAALASQFESKIKELEEKVERLTRTLDMLQEVIGIEVLVSVTGEAGDV